MKIIVNADDFGYSEDTVHATIECIDRGLVSSATIMPNMPASETAIDFARGRDDVSFGLHLTLVADEGAAPCLPAHAIAGLTDKRGALAATNVFRARALLHRLPLDQLEREIAAQLEHVLDRGVAVSHVDSHRHVHKFPNVRRALERMLPRYGIARVRRVQDVYLRRPLASPTVWLGRHWNAPLKRAFVTTDHLYLPSTASDMQWSPRLLDAFGALEGGTLEIGVHPGHEEEWRADELQAVETFTPAAREAGHDLIAWTDLGRQPDTATSADRPLTTNNRKVSIGK